MKVTDNFGLHAESVLAVNELVIRVFFFQLGPVQRGLPIGGAGDNQLNHRLARPFTLDQFTRQPVDQFWMGWALAAYTKVIRGAHQAFAKKFGPEMIYGDPRSQWVTRVYQPAGKIKSITCVSAVFHRRQRAWSTGGDLGLGLLEFTPV